MERRESEKKTRIEYEKNEDKNGKAKLIKKNEWTEMTIKGGDDEGKGLIRERKRRDKVEEINGEVVEGGKGIEIEWCRVDKRGRRGRER